jgi:hypothetical protein
MGRKPLLFGEYLRKKRIISAKDPVAAYYLQEQINKQVGLLAVKHKMIAAQKVQQILNQQSKSRRRRNEITIDFKQMTRSQAKDLLEYQAHFNINIRDIFKFDSKLPKEELQREIEEFSQFRESRS